MNAWRFRLPKTGNMNVYLCTYEKTEGLLKRGEWERVRREWGHQISAFNQTSAASKDRGEIWQLSSTEEMEATMARINGEVTRSPMTGEQQSICRYVSISTSFAFYNYIRNLSLSLYIYLQTSPKTPAHPTSTTSLSLPIFTVPFYLQTSPKTPPHHT